MQKMLISIPDQLAERMRASIPARMRSKTIAYLLEKELDQREQRLYECAKAVEEDSGLHKEMDEWDITLNDGLDDEAR